MAVTAMVGTLCLPLRAFGALPKQEGKDRRDRRVQHVWDGLALFHVPVQGAGQRPILHDRHARPPRLLANLGRMQIAAFAQHMRCGHITEVEEQSHCIVRRMGDHDAARDTSALTRRFRMTR